MPPGDGVTGKDALRVLGLLGLILRGFGVEGVAEAVAEEVEGEEGEGEGDGWDDEQAGVGFHVVGAFAEEDAQELLGDSTPRPRKERVASVRTNPGTVRVA